MDKETAKEFKGASIVSIRPGKGNWSTVIYAEIISKEGDHLYYATFEDCVDVMREALGHWKE